MPQSRRAEAGVCIVRVEAQPDHLLITVTTHRNIAHTVHSARAERIDRFADREAALATVETFLGSFRPDGQRH